jgi:hypothetical protein
MLFKNHPNKKTILREKSDTIFIFFTALCFWRSTFLSSSSQFLSWDDTELIRLSRCFSESIWVFHQLPDSVCISNQWRSPLFQALLGIAPFSSDPGIYARNVLGVYSIILALASWFVSRTLARIVHENKNRILVSALVMSVAVSQGFEIFRVQQPQVDGFVTLLCTYYALRVMEICGSSAKTNSSFVSLFLLTAALPLIKLSTVVMLPLAALLVIRSYKMGSNSFKRQALLLLIFLSTTTIFLMNYPAVLNSSFSLSFGSMADFYSTNNNHNISFKIQILKSFSIPLLLSAILAFVNLKKSKRGLSVWNKILVVYLFAMTVFVFVLPATDFHYWAPILVPTVFVISLSGMVTNEFRNSPSQYRKHYSYLSTISILIVILIGFNSTVFGLESSNQIRNALVADSKKDLTACVFSDSPSINYTKMLYVSYDPTLVKKIGFINLSDDEMNGLGIAETFAKIELCDYVIGEPSATLNDSIKNGRTQEIYKYLVTNRKEILKSSDTKWVIFKGPK